MNSQPTDLTVGSMVMLQPTVEGHKIGKLLSVGPFTGQDAKEGDRVYTVQCGSLRYRLINWRIVSMSDQPETVEGNIGDVPVEERPTVYAGKAKRTRRAKTKDEAPKTPTPPADRAKVPCKCGCGGQTFSHFIPGHDAKAKSMLLKLARNLVGRDDVPKILLEFVDSNEKWTTHYAQMVEKAAQEQVEAEKAKAEQAKKEAEKSNEEGNQS